MNQDPKPSQNDVSNDIVVNTRESQQKSIYNASFYDRYEDDSLERIDVDDNVMTTSIKLEEKEKPFIGCVYRAICPLGKSYVGQTTTKFSNRIQNHFYSLSLKRTQPCETKFCKAMREIGFENFKWEILEVHYTKENLDYGEWFWIRTLNATDPEYGYNGVIPKDKPGTKLWEKLWNETQDVTFIARIANTSIQSVYNYLNKNNILQETKIKNETIQQ
jgi:hypothetical protein